MGENKHALTESHGGCMLPNQNSAAASIAQAIGRSLSPSVPRGITITPILVIADSCRLLSRNVATVHGLVSGVEKGRREVPTRR